MAAVDVSLKFHNENVDYAEVTHLSMLEAWKFVFGIHFGNKSCIVAVSFCLQQVKVYYTCQEKKLLQAMNESTGKSYAFS